MGTTTVQITFDANDLRSLIEIVRYRLNKKKRAVGFAPNENEALIVLGELKHIQYLLAKLEESGKGVI